MLLEKLKEYSERIEQTPIMYKKTPIKWIIDLDATGKFNGFVPTSNESSSGKKKDKGKEFLAPTIGKTINITAKLFAENEIYTFGMAKIGKDKVWSSKRHEYYKALINRCTVKTTCPSVMAVKRFYESYQDGSIVMPEDFQPGDLLTFRVDGTFPIDEPSVRSFWASEFADKQECGQGAARTCLVCGHKKPIVDRLPLKIKGIPGNKAEYALVSHNEEAFRSYGLEASLNSPICHECGEGFGKALNDLIEKPNTHITIGSMVYVFWTREAAEYDIISLFRDPQPEDVKKLLSKPLTGERAFAQDDPLFYCAAFSASGARAVVRDWVVTTLGDVQRSLARYFRMQALVKWDGSEGEPLPLWSLIKSLVIGKEEIPANIPKTLIRFAFNGGELPMSLIFQAAKRERAEIGADKKDKNKYTEYLFRNRSRIALIKMVLMSRKEFLNKEEAMEKIDLSNENPAYLCGRLFGVIESVQRTAMPGVNTTVADRFYGTASTAPASVFGKLMKGCQNHLGKLGKEKPGACKYLEDDLMAVTGRLKAFPAILSLEEQGLFALGYYHQKAYRASQVSERKAKRVEEEAGE